MSVIKQLNYITVQDITGEARHLYEKLCGKQGINCDEYYPWDFEEDSVAASYIGEEKKSVIDQELIRLGIKESDDIHIVYYW